MFKNNKLGMNTVIQSGNKCTVNGVTIEVPKCAKVSVVNGKVYINGKEYKENGLDKLEVVNLTIKTTGEVCRVDSDVSVVVEGNVSGNIDAGVNITVNGNVEGNIDAGVNVSVQGSQIGDVDAGVGVKIGKKVYK